MAESCGTLMRFYRKSSGFSEFPEFFQGVLMSLLCEILEFKLKFLDFRTSQKKIFLYQKWLADAE